jgi:DNA processing protein
VDHAKARALLAALGPEGLERADAADWSRAVDLTLDRARRWRAEALAFDAAEESRLLESVGARLVAHGDADYPELLASEQDAPIALYVWGRMDDLPAVALVGSRAPTEYGRRMARRLASDLARRGVIVVSGLARGIDAEGHEAAVRAGGKTWAVLGSGLGTVYPPENRDLVQMIVEGGGCIVTEHPFRARPRRDTFLSRNRIIAALSWAAVVVEGDGHSGALVTATRAAEYGREVLAVPGPADSPLSVAPHRLLRDGARLAAGVEDILAVLPPGLTVGALTPRRGAPPEAPGEEAKILHLLGGDSLSLDELAKATGLDMAHLSLIMFGLEIKELVSAVPGQRYAKKSR